MNGPEIDRPAKTGRFPFQGADPGRPAMDLVKSAYRPYP